jgi:RCC1 and BTB domain-containing protein
VRIIGVACGCYHSLALSDEGKVYPFGRNNHGQLGLETAVDCLTPQIIPTLRNVFVKKVRDVIGARGLVTRAAH